MILNWFVNEKKLFNSEGDVPLVGQTVYFHDYTSIPPKGKRKYSVIRIDRSVMMTVKDMRKLKIAAKDHYERYYEAIQIIEKESEGGKVVGVDPPFFKIAKDVAEIHLVVYSGLKTKIIPDVEESIYAKAERLRIENIQNNREVEKKNYE